MRTPRINERAWAVDVITEINRLASSRRCSIKSAGGEWSVAAEELETVLRLQSIRMTAREPASLPNTTAD